MDLSIPMLSVAIPDSSLAEESTLREKSIKAARIARILAIFGVESVLIYRDATGDHRRDGMLLKLVLEFMDTPQYLRKRLYGRMKDLRYAGLFPPLKAPHHRPYVRLEDVRVNDLRQGVVLKIGDRYYVDVGLDEPVPLEHDARVGERVSIVFTSPYPEMRCRIARRDEIEGYWGYNVRYTGSVTDLLRSLKGKEKGKGKGGEGKNLVIVTSKLGRPVREIEHDIASADSILLIFGSPYRDVQEIAGRGLAGVDMPVYNFFPEQRVESIRLEEAMLGCLAVVNYIRDFS
ncbi:MAG: hypothetical protein NZ888_02725 [Candidatus Nitrosocaldus sp.]|nr:hypothetical protein [Candidatus Nitrosocaldus sp.]